MINENLNLKIKVLLTREFKKQLKRNAVVMMMMMMITVHQNVKKQVQQNHVHHQRRKSEFVYFNLKVNVLSFHNKKRSKPEPKKEENNENESPTSDIEVTSKKRKFNIIN